MKNSKGVWDLSGPLSTLGLHLRDSRPDINVDPCFTSHDYVAFSLVMDPFPREDSPHSCVSRDVGLALRVLGPAGEAPHTQ